MACTYTLIDADGKQITLNGPAEFKAYLTETGLNQFYPDGKYPWSPKVAEIQPSAQIDFAASQAFANRLINGESFKTIVQARKALTIQPIEAGTELAKQADEAIELAGVLAARQIVDKGMSQADTFDALVKIADQMPILSVRTSESIAQQAYSTPLPLAYVASVRAGITKQSTVVEPTAGNGALIMAANPKLTAVNELNKARFDALKEQGFDATNDDAVTHNFGNRDADVVIANPPFGVIKDENNKTITFHIAGGYNTNEIDHAIALNALKAMGENGKAVLIVGGPSKMLSDEKRSDAYNGKAKRSFYFTLYNQYNVTNHFTVSGDLYAKQGAAWPVDVIVIDGVGKSQLKLPAANLPRIINSIEELKNELETNRASLQQAPISVEQATRSQTETGDAGRALGNKPSADTESNQNRQPVSVLHGLGRNAERNGSNGGNLRQHNDNIAGQSARPNKPTDTVENKFQAPYFPGSSVNPVGTLVPVNMQASIESALQRVIDKHGNLDSYVADLLDYPLQDIGKYFSAEQVDAIALALDNIESGKGFIIGDQTGVGKGRVNAAMIRYATKNNIVPIFVTEKENLYGDMIRDLQDIGMPEIKPFPTNSKALIPMDKEANEWYEKKTKAEELGEKAPAKYGRLLESGTPAKQNKLMANMADQGKLIDADVIFTTYSQMQTVKGAETDRMKFLDKMGGGALLILDESHNAGGGTVNKEGESVGRAAMARKLVNLAKGVFYSSATYAKRPDVLDLYSKTDMGLVANPELLKESLIAGGIPLQQSVASMLAKAGQYIRREKSFDGIVYETSNIEVNKQMAEKTSEIMREIMKFDDFKQRAVKELSKELKSEAGTIRSDMATGNVGASSANFSSVMHNMIGQMLLLLKTKPAVDEAIEALKRGEKPVITLSNTMGSVISEYANEMGLNVGDAIDLDVGYLLKRYAQKSRRVTIGDAYGKKVTKELTNEELGPLAVRQFNKIMGLIDGFDFSEFPISPLDYIHNELAKAGYKSNEITGRSVGVDYSTETPTYKTRSGQDKTPAGKRKIINDFNNGKIDVIILNQSGSTGISLHSSPKVGSDTRKRHMIIAQPELNIDTHMQMLGRVNRTGQLNLPSYSQLAADIPAEKRPSAILAKKMAMLNANTTAGKESAVKAKDVPDFMNQYGDEVVASIMRDNPEIHKILGEPLGSDFDKDNAIQKVSGRIPVLSLKEQEVLYQIIEDEYSDYIDMLTKTGENQLEAHAMDLQAKTTKEEEVVPPVGDSSSPFAEAVIAKTVDAKKLGKPYSVDQIKELIAKQGITTAESKQKIAQEFSEKLESEYKAAASEIDKMDQDDQLAIDRKNAALNGLNSQKNFLGRMFSRFMPGKAVLLTSPNGVQYLGITGKFERKGASKNYFAPGQWKITVYVADASKQLVIPLSKLSEQTEVGRWTIESEPLDTVKAALEEGQSSTREQRIILTGNMLAAYGFNKTGQIVNYTDENNEVHQGVLMPKKFDLKQAIEAKPVIFDTPDMAISFYNDADVSNKSLRSGDNSLRLVISGSGINLYVPASKAKGGIYFTNKRLTDLLGNFIKRGNEMVARVPYQDVQETIRALYPLVGSMQPISKEEGKKFLEKKGIKYSKSAKIAVSTIAEIKSMMPKRVRKLVDSGKVKIIATSEKGTEAYYDTQNDVLVLVADMLNKDNLESVLAHELFHRAKTTDAKTKAALDKFENDLDKRFQLARGGEGSVIEQRAAQRVIDANTPVADRLEEFGAYLVTEYKSLPVNVKKIIDDFIAAIRMTLLRHGLDMGFIKTLTPADLHALSRYGANAKAAPVSGVAKTVSRVEENIPETIDVDGVQRPTRNSNGQLIHQTQDSIRKFWKWFGDSKIVDKQGRPIPMYHGTPKRFEQPVFRTNSGALLGNGAYFTSNVKESDQYASSKGEAPTIYSVYLKVENPKVTNRFLERVEKQRIRDTNDGVEFNKPNTNDKWVVTFKPEQIKSLDNFGEFSEANPDIRYSKQFTDLQNKAIDVIQNRIKSSKTFNKWHLTVGTQHHKALIDKEDFGKVFNASLNFETDTARIANESADYAPSLLPKTESLKDVAGEVAGKGFKRIKDAKKISDAIFDTTINETPMTDAELKAKGYSDEQRTMYKEFFAAVNHSLDELAKSDMFRLARSMKLQLASKNLSLQDTAQFYVNQLSKDDDKALFNEKVAQIEKLQSEGYAPLMRFGRYTVDVVDNNTGNREFFGMFETETEANEMEKALADEYPNSTISHGILSQKSWEMFNGVTPETMETFAKMMNVEQDEAFQLYLSQAVNNRSAMKRLIHRKKVPGFAKDPQRILASFITSNARATSKNYNLGELVTAISEIDKRKGDVIDEAVKLYDFVQNPSEAGAQIRGLLFAWYMGGSVASALVNTTQTATTTFPYLHQFGSTSQVTSILGNAMRLAAKNTKAIGGDLGQALRRAEEEGVTAPHELHMLFGESMRTTLASSAMIRPLQKAWGSLHSLTEGYNRRTAFIAAYNLAKSNKHADPFKFAENAVNQTQFVYSKSSRPNWARGTVGSTLFTFKTFTINYLEFLKRLPAQERVIALGVLILMAGLSGLPGADDADDVLDTVGQALGYNTNIKEWKEKVVTDMLGKEAAQFALHGISSFLPVDIGSRLSVGNIIPGTAILKKSETDKTRDVMEFAGAAGSLAQKGIQAFEAAQTRAGIVGKAQAIAHAALPKALSDAYQALDMVQTGYYRDYRGKNVQKVDEADALFKLLGLQPSKVAEPRQRERMLQQDIAMTKAVETDIADLWANGIYEKDQNKVKEAKDMLIDWNKKNPETPIKIKMSQVMKRVKAMKQTSSERLMKTAPKEMRRFAKESLSD